MTKRPIEPTRRLRHLAPLLLCALLAAPLAAVAQPQEGVSVGRNSAFTQLVPAENVERSAVQNYQQMLQQAAAKNALAPADSAQVKRLRGIAQRLIPFAIPWNERAKQWQWEVNLIGSPQINAFCQLGSLIQSCSHSEMRSAKYAPAKK